VAIGAFFPGNNHMYYLVTWIATAAVIVPWSVWDLIRIRREAWTDTPIVAAED
jgi:cytochrome oxidase assembly protein ShyY1